MRFYRSLTQVAAITFDLDNTLYDNHPVISRAEQQSAVFLRQYHPNLAHLQVADFQRLRTEPLEGNNDIYHDVSYYRWQVIYLELTRHGLTPSEAQAGADIAMENFTYWRSQIKVPQATHQTLSALAARYPLAAITNGNADTRACGLNDYFQFVLRAGPDGRAKPDSDMYHRAAKLFDLPLKTLLHVGDDLTTDVAGALRCGIQTCWFNNQQENIMSVQDGRLLPHIEISRLASLSALL